MGVVQVKVVRIYFTAFFHLLIAPHATTVFLGTSSLTGKAGGMGCKFGYHLLERDVVDPVVTKVVDIAQLLRTGAIAEKLTYGEFEGIVVGQIPSVFVRLGNGELTAVRGVAEAIEVFVPPAERLLYDRMKAGEREICRYGDTPPHRRFVDVAKGYLEPVGQLEAFLTGAFHPSRSH